VGSLKRVDHSDGSELYCCLGVLTEVMGNRAGTDAYLPGVVSQQARLSKKGDKAVQRKLATMNDFDKKNFYEIADWIEQNL
jgi:hypothetical protein